MGIVTTLKAALTTELLKSVLSASLLKEILPDALVNRGIAPMDANDMTKAGAYRLDRPDSEDPALKKNYPASSPRAMIVVFPGDYFCIQLFVAQATSTSFIRLQWASGGWSPWKAIT